MAFSRFQWWTMPLWGGKEEKGTIFNGSLSHSSTDYGCGFGKREPDTVKFPLKGTRVASSSSRRVKKKWHSREERKVDRGREHDAVVVPADGVCLSGSDSDDSDWSIGWLEPHGPDFLSDDETDESFAVLVPCYKNDRKGMVEGINSQLLNAIQNLTYEHLNGFHVCSDNSAPSLNIRRREEPDGTVAIFAAELLKPVLSDQCQM